MLSPSAPNDVARLSVIEEDGDAAPRPSSPRASHRPFNRRWRDDPPRHSFEASPPEYNIWDTTGPKGERLFDLRNHKHIAKRGGWKRLFLIILLVIAALVALSIGLGLGLTRSNGVNGSSASSSATPSSSPAPYPAGSYALPVHLTTVSSNCTANPATWRCYPFTTFASSANLSLVTFYWIITVSGSPRRYDISSADNPFVVTFANVSLTLLEPGTDDERYHFSLPYDQASDPNVQITADDSQARCFYNRTTFEADMYTRKMAEDPPKVPSKAVSDWQNWPHAVEVMQSIGGGQDVPNCYELANGNIGARITTGLNPQPVEEQCQCIWKNYDL